MAVTENGEVYSWGNNNVGQLGIGKCENQTLPYQISALSGIVIISCVQQRKQLCNCCKIHYN